MKICLKMQNRKVFWINCNRERIVTDLLCNRYVIDYFLQ